MENKRDQRPYNVAYYQAHRIQELERVQTRQRDAVEFVRGLRDVPCEDCGGRFPPYAMDFDHRDGDQKAFWVTQRAGSVSRDRLLAELEKCDIVCANRHRARTHARALERRRIRTRQAIRRGSKVGFAAIKPYYFSSCAMSPAPTANSGFHSSRWTSIIGILPNPADKLFEVPRMLGRVTTQELLEEVSKCDIVCANCHRDRTYRWHAARRIEIARE